MLLKVLRCGICGSDLHARQHCDRVGALMVRSGYKGFMRSDQDILFGHEFCGEVLDHGLDSRKSIKPGTRVCAMPVLKHAEAIDLRFVLGYSPLEYRDALHAIVDGRIKCAPLITGHVGLAGVDAAFSALRDPERHAKILIDPGSTAATPD